LQPVVHLHGVVDPATFQVQDLERDQGIVLRLDSPLPPVLLSRRRRYTPLAVTLIVVSIRRPWSLVVLPCNSNQPSCLCSVSTTRISLALLSSKRRG
jgi:hypothetical protein